MGCNCSKSVQTVTKYRVIHNGRTLDFLAKHEADAYRTSNGLTAPVQVVKVPKT